MSLVNVCIVLQLQTAKVFDVLLLSQDRYYVRMLNENAKIVSGVKCIMYYLVAAEFAKIGCSSASARYKFKVQYVLSLPHPTRLTRDGNSKSELLLKFQNHYHNLP